jgi:hypothetical protein
VGKATLGFPGGPAIAFRIDPDSISWSFEVLTNVVETIGGRVIQIIGSQLEDLTLTGSFGQDHSTPQGESWRQAEAFLLLIQRIMDYQSQDANQQAAMHPPAVFTYPPKNWRFNVYVKNFEDADNPGTSVVLTPGKFNQRWQLTLFIVQDSSTLLVQAGESNGVINQQAQAAIAAYMARISDGIGWTFSQYTGLKGGADLAKDQAAAAKLYPNLASQGATVGTAGGTAGSATPGGGGVTPSSASESDFIKAVLANMGAPPSAANVNSLASWFKKEFPSWPPAAGYNPMATTQKMPGSTQYNSVGVQNYSDAKTGALATSNTLVNGHYPGIVAALKSGNGLCGGGLASEFSTWSGGGYTSVC